MNARRKGNLQVLGINGSEHHQTSREGRENVIKGYLERTRKLLETKLCNINYIKRIDTLVPHPCKKSCKIDKGKFQTNKAKDNKVDDDVEEFTPER